MAGGDETILLPTPTPDFVTLTSWSSPMASVSTCRCCSIGVAGPSGMAIVATLLTLLVPLPATIAR